MPGRAPWYSECTGVPRYWKRVSPMKKAAVLSIAAIGVLTTVVVVVAVLPAGRNWVKTRAKFAAVATNGYQDSVRRMGLRPGQIGNARQNKIRQRRGVDVNPPFTRGAESGRTCPKTSLLPLPRRSGAQRSAG